MTDTIVGFRQSGLVGRWRMTARYLVRFNCADAAAFRRISGRFADAIMLMAQPSDVIWVHDYHLIPLARALRDRGWKGPVGAVPAHAFPQVEALSQIPVADNPWRTRFRRLHPDRLCRPALI